MNIRGCSNQMCPFIVFVRKKCPFIYLQFNFELEAVHMEVSQPALPRSHLYYKIPLKLKSVHVRSKPAHLADITVHLANISPSQDENCEYEHSQASQSGQAGLNIVHNVPVGQLFTNFINENNYLKKIQGALKVIVYNANDCRISFNNRMIVNSRCPLISAAPLDTHTK